MIEKITKENIENLSSDYFIKEVYLSEFTNNPFSQVYVYYLNNDIAGIIQYDIIYDRAELSQIDVKPEYQNQKIASTLIESMIKECKNNNVKNITLEVKKDNDVAIHLYKKYGFKETAIRKGYYQGIDGILMEKEMIE